MSKIMLTLRGWAGGTAQGTQSPTHRAEIPTIAQSAAHRLLHRCRTERPELWAALDASFQAAMKRRAKGAGGTDWDEPDPWLVESAVDRARAPAGQTTETARMAPVWVVLLMAGVFWAGLAYAHAFPRWTLLSRVSAVSWTLLLAVQALPIEALRRLEARSVDWYRRVVPLPPFQPQRPFARFSNALMNVPLLSLLTLLVRAKPILLVGLAGLARSRAPGAAVFDRRRRA